MSSGFMPIAVLMLGLLFALANPGPADYQDPKYHPCTAEDCAIQGDRYFKQWRYDEALRDYDRALKIDGQLAHAYLGRGSVFLKQHNPWRAEHSFQKALSLYEEQNKTHEVNIVRSLIADLRSGKRPACLPVNPQRSTECY